MSDVQEPIEGTSRGSRPGARRDPRRPPSLFWPLLLIGGGVLLLLSNLGYLPWESWGLLWRLWPLLLIALGVDVLIGRRSTVGAIISAVLILLLIGSAVLLVLFAEEIPALQEFTSPVEWQIEHVEYPLEGLESASITIDWTSLPGDLGALSDSPNLIEGDVSYRGDLVFDVDPHGDHVEVELDNEAPDLWLWPASSAFDEGRERHWEVKLSPDVPLELLLDVGSGSCSFDLTELSIDDLVIDGGSGSVDLTLPAGSTFEVYVDGGSGSMDIVLPESVGAEVDLDSGSGFFDPGDRFRLASGERRGDGVWETDNFDTAEHTIRFEINQGSGAIKIH